MYVDAECFDWHFFTVNGIGVLGNQMAIISLFSDGSFLETPNR